MIIINSGTYITPEFQSEIGRIPPCLLPLGNKKLIEHQVQSLKCFPSEQIFVTLPDDFELSHYDKQLLQRLQVEIIKVDASLSLAESVLLSVSSVALSSFSSNTSHIRLLHGDTLLSEYPQHHHNLIGVGTTQDSYQWEIEDYKDDLVWCGYFVFESIAKLVQCLACCKTKFVDAINMYRSKESVELYYFSQWYDLGHINTYFKSRAKITTERAFNHLRIENNVVYKSGMPEIKIKAEAEWFQNIPKSMRRFIPQYIDSHYGQKNTWYQLEYLPLLPLNELFVHGRVDIVNWKNIISQLINLLNILRSYEISNDIKRSIDDGFYSLIVTKTYERLENYAKKYQFNLDNPIRLNGEELCSTRQLATLCVEQCQNLDIIYAVQHGDLCFSNILYNSRQEQLKIIDPRGITGKGELSIYGNQYYDLAKIMHSVIGLYDLIIAGQFQYNERNSYDFSLRFYLTSYVEQIQKVFIDSFAENDLKLEKIAPLIVLLFLSMLPLHSDYPNRQKAMLANAFRLYVEYMK